MRLNDVEKALLAGEAGEPRRIAIEQQIRVGRFFDAEDFVEVSQVHLMADTESLGPAGVELLERMAARPDDERRVRVPTITTFAEAIPRRPVTASTIASATWCANTRGSAPVDVKALLR